MAYYVLNTGSDLDLTSKGKRLASWHMSSAAATVTVNLRNGSASGDIVAQIQLAANTSASQAYSMPTGLLFPNGLFVDWVTGTVTGSVDLH